MNKNIEIKQAFYQMGGFVHLFYLIWLISITRKCGSSYTNTHASMFHQYINLLIFLTG